ncbi:DUF4394 domain-containing protein [Streptomyces sp. NBC_00457]|uniref:DUF4394 domain-containing protein n=1 Tax=Streptomyces sp. NBC_00457 TaxID=2975748 RepID=UPI002E246C84
MKSGTRKRLAAAIAVVSVSSALMLGLPGSGSAAATPSLVAFGITGDGTQMAMFTTDKPNVNNWVRDIVGLSGDTTLIGIDFRVQNGLMYGVGNQGGIYTIKTPPATTDVVITKVSQLQYTLHGTNFGVDFNPAADRLRVISDTGQNLRHNLNDNTTIQDVNLTTPPIEGTTKGVSAAAYTNNDLNGATATTLFDVNTTTDQVVIQSPANNGTLAATGSLGIDAQINAGMDIFSTLSGGKTVSNAAFAALSVPGANRPSLYSINIFTGEATLVADAATSKFAVNLTDLAISLTGS